MNEQTITLLEKYTPKTFQDIVGQPNIVKILSGYVKSGNVPHLMFAGTPGCGKTATANVIARALYGEYWRKNLIMLNSSSERGIDTVRGKIKDSTMYQPIGGAPFKLIFLDEADFLCLVEGTKIVAGFNTGSRLCNIEDVPTDRYTSICSLNLKTKKIERDKGICINTGISEVYRITLEDGRTIECTSKHPFFVLEGSNIIEKQLCELSEDDEIIDFSGEVVNSCEICGEYTMNERFCSIECKDIGHSKDMTGEGNSMHGKEAWNKNKTKYDDDRIGLQGHSGDSNPSKRPDVKIKAKAGLQRFYGSEEGKRIVEERNKKLSIWRTGKTYEEIYDDPDARRHQCSSRYRETGVFLGGDYKRYLPDTDEVECEICNEMIKKGGSAGIYVHHIDANHENNDRENLMFVCPKCHNMICHNCKERFLQKGWDVIR